jgi:hypothetical protein
MRHKSGRLFGLYTKHPDEWRQSYLTPSVSDRAPSAAQAAVDIRIRELLPKTRNFR